MSSRAGRFSGTVPAAIARGSTGVSICRSPKSTLSSLAALGLRFNPKSCLQQVSQQLTTASRIRQPCRTRRLPQAFPIQRSFVGPRGIDSAGRSSLTAHKPGFQRGCRNCPAGGQKLPNPLGIIGRCVLFLVAYAAIVKVDCPLRQSLRQQIGLRQRDPRVFPTSVSHRNNLKRRSPDRCRSPPSQRKNTAGRWSDLCRCRLSLRRSLHEANMVRRSRSSNDRFCSA